MAFNNIIEVLFDIAEKKQYFTTLESTQLLTYFKSNYSDLLDKEKVTLLTDAASLAEGKKLYETSTCAACHKPDGGGSIGPNLTDDHWILGGGIKNVFNTLMEGGREGKGMVAWKATIKPADLQKIASYVISLQGSNPPDAKPAEGDVWVDENTPAPAAPAEAEKPAEEVVVQ